MIDNNSHNSSYINSNSNSNSNSISNSNSNSNSNNNERNSKLFYKIWHNHYLKNKILYDLKKFNFNYYSILVRSYLIKDSFLKELQEGYIRSLVLYSNSSKEKLLDIFKLLPNSTDYSIQLGDHSFNEPFLPHELPHYIERLVFSLKWNQEITLDVLPFRLRTLIFNQEYNKPISSNILPKTLTHLEFGNDFNFPLLPGTLNDGLKVLKFSNRSEFNQQLTAGCLPSSLTSVRFGKFFNQILDSNVLPYGLTSLKYFKESVYNKPFKIDSLPNSITILKLGEQFNQPLYYYDDVDNNNNNNNNNHHIYKSLLPYNLKKLKFYNSSYKQIKSTIFDNSNNSTNGGFFSFINQFKELRSNNSYYLIPDSIETLKLSSVLLIDKDCLFSNGLRNLKTLDVGSNIKNIKLIPPTVEKLVVDVVLPPSFPVNNNIKYLKIGDQFDVQIKNELSALKKLIRLSVGSSYNYPIIENSIPESVEFIEFGEYFNQELIKSSLPKNLKHISLGSRYTKPFKSEAASFPINLESLRLGNHYWREISKDQLPKSLKVLELGLDFKLNGSDFIPNSVEKLIIRGNIQTKQQLPVLPSTLSTLFIHSNYKYLLDSTYKKEDSLESLKPIIKLFSNNKIFLEDEANCDYLFKNIIKSILNRSSNK